jgi:hypothetical protein
MSGEFHDALYMCTRLGCPSFFITFTASPNWPDITEAGCDTYPTSTSKERAKNTARMFKQNLDDLIHDMMHKQIFRKGVGIYHVIRYQKHDLPRAHTVIIIHPDDRHKTSVDIDKLVPADIPREHPAAASIETTKYLIWARKSFVTHILVHSSWGAHNPSEFIAIAIFQICILCGRRRRLIPHSLQSLLKTAFYDFYSHIIFPRMWQHDVQLKKKYLQSQHQAMDGLPLDTDMVCL